MDQAVTQSTSSRTLSVRTRFEIFKRDDFTCRYCGRKSPEVVLQVDHITPHAAGGSADPMNLATSCWDCNSGKSDVPLDRVMTGDDPGDKAIELLERERQLGEYNAVLARIREAREADIWALVRFWNTEIGLPNPESTYNGFYNYLRGALKRHPREQVQEAMEIAIGADKRDIRYVAGVLRQWRGANGPDREVA